MRVFRPDALLLEFFFGFVPRQGAICRRQAPKPGQQAAFRAADKGQTVCCDQDEDGFFHKLPGRFFLFERKTCRNAFFVSYAAKRKGTDIALRLAGKTGDGAEFHQRLVEIARTAGRNDLFDALRHGVPHGGSPTF